MAARRTLVAGLLGASLALATGGCGSSDDPSPAAPQPAPPAETREAPAKPPAGVSARPGTPEEAIRSLYYFAQWGNYPGVVRLYAPRVRESVGPAELATVYSLNREALLTFEPRIVDQQKTPDGTFVAVEVRRTDGPPNHESYLLHRRGSTWEIRYDTYFDRAYGDLARINVDGPARDEPSREGATAAREASRQFRSLYLPGARGA